MNLNQKEELTTRLRELEFAAYNYGVLASSSGTTINSLAKAVTEMDADRKSLIAFVESLK